MTQQNDLGAIQVSGQEMADLLAEKTDLEVARFINLSLLMHKGISEQDAGFDKVVCLNDAGLSKVASIVAALRRPPLADMARICASETACYRWSEDTAEHRAMREAFMDGAAFAASAPTEPDIRAALRRVRSGSIDAEVDIIEMFAALAPTAKTGVDLANRIDPASPPTGSDDLLLTIHALIECHGRKYPDRYVSVFHRNIVLGFVAAALRGDLPPDPPLAALSPAGDTGREAVPVGWFNPWNDYHGYQQVAKEFEGSPGTIPLYASPQPAARIGREEIAKLVLTAIMSKADAYVYGTSYAMKHNEERAQKTADAILALTARDAGSDVTRANCASPPLQIEDI